MDNRAWIIGIDPGKYGGIVELSPDGDVNAVIKMPDTMADLFELLVDMSPGPVRLVAYLERLQPMPAPKETDGQRRYSRGPISAFKSGVGYGALQMALTACRIPFELVSSGKWERAMGVSVTKGKTFTTTQKKNMHKEKAQQLFPSVKVIHAVADALLIAEYGRRVRLATPEKSDSNA